MKSPGDFRALDVYPTKEEILGGRSRFRKNIIKGAYRDIEDYLDVHFRLLREDFVSFLRNGVSSYRSREPTKNIDVYNNVRISKEQTKFNRECLKIKVKLGDDDSKKFMMGSLLLFTKDDFTTNFLAKVAQRRHETHEITVEPVGLLSCDINVAQTYTMAECTAYFDPYFQVLTALQTMSAEDVPMTRYLIDVDTASVYIPRYLLNCSNYDVNGHSVSPGALPKLKGNVYDLNAAQTEAFAAALSQEFVVIQGPPGTGKTHLGLKIAETLIRNSRLWYRNSPMLVVSHKNHALDRFLEGLLDVTTRLVRVGGQSRSDKLKPFGLNYLKNVKGKDGQRALSEALVVGMTTSLAARRRGCLEGLRCPIVMVEEAAEVLESHVVASVNRHCQHLILLGDHEQLQPIASDYVIGRDYHLGVSLFERMVKNGIQCYRLDVQHRMRPKISDLLRVTIYPFLKDHDSVKGRPPVRGVTRSLFFVDHGSPEETFNMTSKRNPQEAAFVVALARYLVLNGYKPEQIVILAAYAGQVQELEGLAKRSANCKHLEQVKISTTDAFQGQECDIVLMSLVRSEGVGFLATRNRICVGLSRAKVGFYMFGSMDLLATKSKLWGKVEKCLERKGCLGQSLTLQCQNHPEKLTEVECADDFAAVFYGGCNKKCQSPAHCGHPCSFSCHGAAVPHTCSNQCIKLQKLRDNRRTWQNFDEDDGNIYESSYQSDSYNYDYDYDYNYDYNNYGVRQERGIVMKALISVSNLICNVVGGIFLTILVKYLHSFYE